MTIQFHNEPPASLPGGKMREDTEAGPRHPTPFDLKVVEAGKMALARIDGPFDLEHTSEVLDRLAPLCTSIRRLVVDLRRAEYMDSAGVRAMLSLQDRLAANSAELRLVLRDGSRVQRTLQLLRLEDSFKIYDSVSTAWIRRAA